MHRVRTWARAKAHGPSPLLPDGRRAAAATPRHNAAPTPAAPAANPAPATTSEPKPETSVEVAPPQSKRAQRASKGVAARFGLTLKDILFSSYINVLLVFVPVGIAVHFAKASAGIIFAMNAIAIIPLAGLLSHATESVAVRMGDTIGALMNVTFGNAVELIIFIIALVKNEIRIVQASLLGSILANLLLILGMCFLFGGLRYREQIYNSTVTQMSACLLSLSVTSLLLPTAFHASFTNNNTADDKVLQVSRGVSVILLLVYILYLVFQLNSHSYMYESTPQHIIERETHPGPAAQYFNSSSSSETSSSSSSSDTDDSSRSTTTVKKIKKMMKRGKKNRNESTSSPDATASGSTDAVPPEITRDIAGRDVQDPVSVNQDGAILLPAEVVDAMATDEAVDAGDEMADHPKQHRQKHKHHKRRHHARHKAGNDDGDDLEQTQSAPTPGERDDRRVEFAVVQDVEGQPQNASPKPFALRLLRPNITKSLSQNVFSTPTPSAGSSNATNQSQQPRRINSLPLDSRNPTYRTSPGILPPIVPIVVNSTPKTQTAEEEEHGPEAEISRTTAVLLLLGSTGLVALCAEFMVDSINEVVASGSGVSEAFIGLILLPIVGNAAEHVTAVTVAMKNKMDLAIGVALGSSIQIALFVTPLVVILGWIMNKEMSLYFTLFETVTMFVSAFIVNFLVLDGRSNYLEGALLCSAYVIIAVAAFFYPDADSANLLGGGDADGNATESVVAGATLMARGFASLVGL
ncbi:calcium/proton exchanger [Coniochaeta ligniaria NRRL 30616]|uniref:Calcium/proton exchanger n=1 Tax=Coniochaeta ligniaria NRRL 30616 TaxID=1408157 RepID=A0A1J7JZ01_9PEZI|nr:calcium/proton exchanger [Coniochaeta ligniaria NRRL 30616]